MFLAIDIGNTHVDLGLFSSEPVRGTPTTEIICDLVSHTKHPTHLANPDELQQLLSSLPTPLKGAAIGSVVAGMADIYAELCRPLCQGPVVHLTGTADWKLCIDYDDPDRVGVDRLAAAAAGHYLTPDGHATIIADAGTALTVDAVDAEGTFLGGAIAPGMRLGLQALGAGTSLLPQIEVDAAAALWGKTTAAGLRSGALYGSAALIEGLCHRMAAELDGPTTVFLTGGDSPILHPLITGIDTCDKALVLRGLALAYNWYSS